MPLPVTQRLLRTGKYNMAVRENLSNAPPAPPAPSAPVPMLPPAPPRPNEVVSRPVAQDKVGNHTASQNRKAPNMENIPLGHTAFSWPAVSTAVPLGHTAFSWESKLENNNLPPLAKILRLQGNKFFAKGKYHEAALKYEKGLEAIPALYKKERSMLHLNLAAAYIRLNRLAQAEISATNSARLNPANPKAWYRLAKVLELSGKLTEAIESLETGIVVVGSKQNTDASILAPRAPKVSTSRIVENKQIKSLKSLLRKYQSRMIHEVHTTQSKVIASKPLDKNTQAENLNKLNTNILQSSQNTHGSGSRERPTAGVSIKPHKLSADFPSWYLESRGKDTSDLPQLGMLSYVSEDKEEDVHAVEVVKRFFNLEKRDFAPRMRKYALFVQNIVSLDDLKKCKNPFAKHNRSVFCKAAELLACDIMATDKLSIARSELGNLDPLATLLVLFSLVRALPPDA